MREIKFRAWHVAARRMYYSRSMDMQYTNNETDRSYYMPVSFKLGTMPRTRVINSSEDGDEVEDLLRLMQYTGLKDKNGVDIYEGDIVKWGHLGGWSSEDPVRIAEVCFNPDIQYHSQVGVFEHGGFAYAHDADKYLEVIGNIYENPELLDNVKA